jgi:hypothetical protein
MLTIVIAAAYINKDVTRVDENDMKVANLERTSDFLGTTKPSSITTVNAKRENRSIRKHSNKLYFQICNSCYWCTTYFGISDLETLSESSSNVLDCQYCDSHNTNLMPVLPADSFRMEYDITRDMEIAFHKNTSVSIREQSDLMGGYDPTMLIP